MLHVTPVCTPCCMMLLFGGSCCGKFETGESFEPTFLLFRDSRSVALQCWIRLHSSSKTDWTTHAHCIWFTKTNGLYPSHDALQVPTLLGVIATVCTPLPPFAHHCRPFARSFITDLKTILPVARLGNKESLALESEIQLTESGIQLTIGVRNPSFY